MKTEVLKKRIELLSILVDGCKRHPVYRAIRPATGRYARYVEIWQARQELEQTCAGLRAGKFSIKADAAS